MPRRPAGLPQAAQRPSRTPSAPAARADGARTQPRASTVLPFLTVALGASAGGLHAFTEFLTHLPSDTGMAFVLIQHLDPAHKSLLVELLAPHTTMRAVEAVDGMRVVPNTVFVIPPDATMTIGNGRLMVSGPAPALQSRWPIDSFFASLAKDQGRNAVCIVLSGTGRDGARSLPAVKQLGGLILAQADDQGQALAGMPHSAVATGLVNHLLTVSAMPRMLVDHWKTWGVSGKATEVDDPTPADPTQFAEICALLRDHTGHDFSHYKQATLMRRLQHRMQALQIASVPDFILRLRDKPEAIDALFHDLLIGVTQFMRDGAAFRIVQQIALSKILEGRRGGEPVRLWVAGCASGEEVYTLAILLKELIGERQAPATVQIFGTDIDEVAIATARTARYRRQALARFTPQQRDRWFVPDGELFRLVPAIREMCVFSLHSVIRDPPFSKLDMISCRNLLIYLGGELQVRVIRNFHYALRPDGWLFLGASEGVARCTDLFAQIDNRHRLFQRQGVPAVLPGQAPNGAVASGFTQSANGTYQTPSVDDMLDRRARRALERYSPAYIVINRACNILRFSGGAVGRFLEPSPGTADLNLFGLLRRPLRRPLRAALRQVIADGATVIQEGLALVFEGQTHVITLIAQPISDGRDNRDCYLVAFHDAGTAPGRSARAPNPTDAAADDDEVLAQELAATRSQLLGTIGDLETANEELRSFNEEYQSTNEELQATNEELETSKEEMQSVNEEFQTINAELITKNELLTKLNNDFQNLLTSTEIATIFLDRNLHITRFTRGMTDLFHLRESDIGRPVTDITGRLLYSELRADVASVLANPEIIERELQLAGSDTSFLMRLRPYRTLERAVDGVVITFVDITTQKRLQALEETTLRTANLQLADRSAELLSANDQLTSQITQREHAEDMLRQSQKLEAVGKLTGGIAHDFNNLLGVIIANIEALLDRLQGDSAGLANEILNSALSGAELTRRLLAFARMQPLQPQVIELNALLSSHVTLLRRTLGDSIHVTARLAADLWPIHADPSQVGDALLNLALNARDAMPNGGDLTIETANMHMAASQATRLTEMTKGDYVVLAVTDTGTGMSPEVVERATEPFFTTKPTASGSGLGLSMIYGFAVQSGGYLKIDSKVGVGSTVRLYLPRTVGDAVAIDAAVEAEAADPGGNEAILLVDDNAKLRAATRRHLIALGYKVDVADSGPAALSIFRSGKAFDLLFTDVVMPDGMSGYNLAEAAQQLQPGLKTLFATGFVDQTMTCADVANGTQRLLYKPFRRRSLAKAVRTVLDADTPAR
jgi:two-component system, chemotaxis family, CheB/CheR fusion protein